MSPRHRHKVRTARVNCGKGAAGSIRRAAAALGPLQKSDSLAKVRISRHKMQALVQQAGSLGIAQRDTFVLAEVLTAKETCTDAARRKQRTL